MRVSEATTVGEKVDRDGACRVMLLLCELANAIDRLPCGEWDYRFVTDPRWRVCLNGGAQAEWTPPDAPAVKRFEAFIEYNGWPAATCNAAEGVIMGGLESQLLAALNAEIAQAGGAV